MTNNSPEAVVTDVLAALPGDEWIAADTLADLLAESGTLPTVPLVAVLGHARRKGWVLRNRKVEPELFKRTPSGTTYVRVQAELAEAAP